MKTLKDEIYQETILEEPKDIKKAVNLAIQKTIDALQSGKLTEVGQTLFDRRKDIEAHTAKKIFAELEENDFFLNDGWHHEGYININKINALKKKYGVD